MKQTSFDAHNQQQITVELTCHGYKPVIMGSGYFIIPNPNSKYVSFSKAAHDVFGLGEGGDFNHKSLIE